MAFLQAAHMVCMLTAGAPTVCTHNLSTYCVSVHGLSTHSACAHSWSPQAESPWELSAGQVEKVAGRGLCKWEAWSSWRTSLPFRDTLAWEFRAPLCAGLRGLGRELGTGGLEWSGKTGLEISWSGRRLSAHPEVPGAGNQSSVRQKGQEEEGLRLDSG